MNVFILDKSMELSAQMLDDAHLKSQISEACQILTTNYNDGRCEEYAVIGHLHHPVTKYYYATRQTEELASYLCFLCAEYYIRFGKEHQNWFFLMGYLHENPQFSVAFRNFSVSKTYVKGRMTDNIDEIHRYIATKPHRRPLTWTRREKPDWWEEYERDTL